MLPHLAYFVAKVFSGVDSLFFSTLLVFNPPATFTVDELEAAADEEVSKVKAGRYELSITFYQLP